MDLMREFGRKYRISMDESFAFERNVESRREKWRYYQIQGRYGVVYPYSESHLSLFLNSKIVFNRFRRAHAAEITSFKSGDGEGVITMPNQYAEVMIRAVKPYKIRHVSEAERQRLASMSHTYGFKRKSHQ